MTPQARIQPVAYKHLVHQQAMLNNLVSGTGRQFQTQIQGKTWVIALSPLTANRQFDLEFQLTVDGLPVRIQTSRDLFSGIAMGGAPLTDLLEQLPDDLRLGCASMVTDRLLADLRALLQKDIRLNRISRCEHIADGTPCLSLSFQSQERTSAGLLVVSDQINSLLNTTLGTAPAVLADHIAMPLAVEIGHTVIADVRLQRLATGDIVILDRSWHKNRKHVFLRLTESTGFLSSLNGAQITLERLIKQGLESGMSDDFDDFDDLDDDLDLGDDFDDDDDLGFSEPAAAAPPPQQPQQPPPEPQVAPASAATPQTAPSQPVSHKDVQGLPVKLVFDVGHHELTVGEVGRLGPGYTFELNRDVTSPVTMRANGKPFAECELVSINNQLGARIVRLL